MAWTTPATFTVGQTLTAASMNTNVRDNTNFLFSPPACKIQRASDVSVASSATMGAITIAPAGGPDYDTDPTMHENVTHPTRITINTGGVYRVSAGIKWAIASGGARYLAIRRDGGTNDIANDSRLPLASDNSWQNVSCDQLMVATDYVEMYAAQTSGSGLNIVGSGNGGCWLAVSWIGKGT